MLLEGSEVTFADPAAANAAGIVCIFQELSLIPDLSVADNIIASNPPTRFGLIDRKAQRRLAEEALARAGAEDIHPLALVKDLPLSRRQMVEIAKALARKPRILILDEATSALTAADVAKVFDVLKRLRAEGLALVYISHRMHEIAELADDCSVFRNGRKVATFTAGTQERRRGRRDDDRPRIQPCLSAQAGRGHARATPRRWKCAHLSWAPRLQRHLALPSTAARSSASAGSTARASASCCWRCSACCAARSGEILIDGKPVSIGSARAPPRPRASAWR